MERYTFEHIKNILIDVIPNELICYCINPLTEEDIENLTHDIILDLENNLD